MGQILATTEPLPLASLNATRRHFPTPEDNFNVELVVKSMGSLLSGTTNPDSPIQLVHTSFHDCLTDKASSGEFFIDLSKARRDLAFASLQGSSRTKSPLNDLRNPDGTRLTYAWCRKRPITAIPMAQTHSPPIDPQQPSFLRLSKLLRFSPRANALPPGWKDQPRDPLDVSATLSLPSSLSGQAAPQLDQFEISSPPLPLNGVTQFLRRHLSFLAPRHSLGPPVVEVAPGRKSRRLAAAKLPEYKKVDDTRYPSRQQAAVPYEDDSSDIDSLPDAMRSSAIIRVGHMAD
ncbi:hypothetical protein F4604DRAFT_1955676 [Suillus subluteus]|nr:hypothetical protein F4604DRAFT_1955676 [Suillus subluteus]